MIDGLSAEVLWADRGYDSSEIVETATRKAMQRILMSQKNHATQCDYDVALNKLRQLVEYVFLCVTGGAG